MGFETGINLVLVFNIDAGPVQTWNTYQILGSSFPNGQVTSEIRNDDIVLTKEDADTLIKTASNWIGHIVSVQKITTKEDPAIPVELSMIPSATGLDYKIEMDTLDQMITWNGNDQLLTIHAAQAFTISLEAYIYYVESLIDLINAIDALP